MQRPYTSRPPVDDFGLMSPSLKYSATVAATTDTSLAVPDGSQRYKAIMKAEADATVWVAVNEAAAAPAGASFAATTSEMIPVNGVMCREVRSSDVLHFYTAGTDIDVSVAFYAVGTNN